MNTTQMVDLVKKRTHDPDDTKVIAELNAAQSWAFNRIYNAEKGPDVLVTMDEEFTLGAEVRTISLDVELAFQLAGLKKLWLKFPGETSYTAMRPLDSNDSLFDGLAIVASAHPVSYYNGNISQVRFSAYLPAGSMIRADYFRFPPALDPTVNNSQDNGSDLPAQFHHAICENATGRRFDLLDDSRAATWISLSERSLSDGIYKLVRGVQSPAEIKRYRR